MQLIGGSIREAIDWTQDHLLTTRPLAERTLFAMIAAKKVTETANGFALVEADGEEETTKKHAALKHGHSGTARPRTLRFHKARKLGHKHLRELRKQNQFQRLDHSDDTDDDDADDADADDIAADGSDNNALS